MKQPQSLKALWHNLGQYLRHELWSRSNLVYLATVVMVVFWLSKEVTGLALPGVLESFVNFSVVACASLVVVQQLLQRRGRQETDPTVWQEFRLALTPRQDWPVALAIALFLGPLLLVVSWDLPYAYHPGDDEYVVPAMHFANARFETAIENPNLSQNPLDENQQLMYYLLTPVFFALKPLGLALWGDATIATAPYFFLARLLNYLIGCLLLWVTYAVAKMLFNRRSATLAVILLAGSKLVMHYALFMRSDLFLTFLVGIVLLVGAIGLRSSYRNFLLLGVLIGLGTGLKPYMLALFLPVIFLMGRDHWRQPNWGAWFERSATVLGGFLVAFHLARFYHNYVVQQFGAGFADSLEHSGGGHYGYYPSVGLDLIHRWGFGLELLAMWAGVAVVAAGVSAIIWLLIRRDRLPGLYLLSVILPVAVILGSQLVQEGKFYLIIWPALMVAIGVLLSDLLSDRRRILRLVGLAVATVLLTQSYFLSYGKLWLLQSGDLRAEAAKWITTHIPPGASIAMLGNVGWQDPPIDRSKYENARISPATDYVVIPSSVTAVVQYWLAHPEQFAVSDWLPGNPPGEQRVTMAKAVRDQAPVIEIRQQQFRLVQVISKEQSAFGLPYDEYFDHPASWELWSVNNPMPILIYERF
jgi:hypothetical protein